MNLDKYIEHYLKTKETFLFLGLTILVFLFIMLVFYIFTVVKAGKRVGLERAVFLEKEYNSLLERFIELIISGGSILFFMAVYYLINRFFDIQPYRNIWDKYKDFLLLFLIVISIIMNRIMDNLLIRLTHLSKEEKSAIRLIGMVYMILIFGYIKFIYENNNYDVFITYFLGLMIGRFVYFDVSFKEFTSSIGAAMKNIPIMILVLGYLAFLSWYGFGTKFLIKHIGVLTNVFFIHVYMCVAAFVIFNIYKICTMSYRRKLLRMQAHESMR